MSCDFFSDIGKIYVFTVAVKEKFLTAIDIEDLSLKSCFLTSLQHLGKLPKELEFFNLAGNDLLTLKGLSKTNAKVFLTGNSLENEKSLKKQNYIFTESWSNLLPDSYMRFFR